MERTSTPRDKPSTGPYYVVEQEEQWRRPARRITTNYITRHMDPIETSNSIEISQLLVQGARNGDPANDCTRLFKGVQRVKTHPSKSENSSVKEVREDTLDRRRVAQQEEGSNILGEHGSSSLGEHESSILRERGGSILLQQEAV